MKEKYVLKLYVVGSNAASEIALRNLKEIIARETESVFELKVIDVIENPNLAEDDKILAIPTLIRKLPEPLKKIIGDLSDKEKILLGLDIVPQIQTK
jgi:circadian clock protein KaiB